MEYTETNVPFDSSDPLVEMDRVLHTEEVDFMYYGKPRRLHQLVVGCVLSYDNSGYGDCSTKPYVVVEVNKNKAIISPIIRYNDNKVVYNSKYRYTIKPVFNTCDSLYRAGWNWNKDSLGLFVHDKILHYFSGIDK